MNDAGRTATAGRALRSTCVAFVLCSLGAHAVAAVEPGARGGAYIALHLVLGGLMLTAVWLSRDAARDDMRWVAARPRSK